MPILNTRWIVAIAIVLSILGHLIFIFGAPNFLFSNYKQLEDKDPSLLAVLKVETVKKIQLLKKENQDVDPKTNIDAISANLPGIGSQTENGEGKGGGQAFRLPPEGIYYYDAFLDGQVLQRARIEWSVGKEGYRLHVHIPYAFVGPFIFESTGKIDQYGLAPSQYVVRIGEKPPRITRFDRQGEGGKVFFSEKPELSPDILPGTQDRFSLMMQFASLLAGDDSIDQAGTVREVPVAGIDSVDVLKFQSQGEMISDAVPSLGPTALRRYIMLPRKDKDPLSRNDIWFVKDFDWVPGRIRLVTEKGRTFELILVQRDALGLGINGKPVN
ncbi:MAG: hypothetical protein JHC80_00160 [Polynucleobacter sp.]|nr:hypothetical protein [Polynucleobacter sp.]